MITKAKTVQYSSSDGQTHVTLADAKERELQILVGDNTNQLAALIAKPREAIAILRLGLPRKPRTVKPKTVKAKKAAVTAAV